MQENAILCVLGGGCLLTYKSPGYWGLTSGMNLLRKNNNIVHMLYLRK